MNMSNYITKNKDTFFKIRKLEKYMTGHKGFIAGGVFKNIFNNEAFRDIDIFFEKQEDYLEAEKFYTNESDWTVVYENKNAKCFKRKNVKIELVKSYFGKPEEILRKFDFTVVKFAYFKHKEDDEVTFKCLYHEFFFEDLINKKLVIDETSSFPINTLERTWKYRSYGYGLCRESKSKIVEMLQGASKEDVANDLYFGFD